jgi:hypothetical protein
MCNLEWSDEPCTRKFHMSPQMFRRVLERIEPLLVPLSAVRKRQKLCLEHAPASIHCPGCYTQGRLAQPVTDLCTRAHESPETRDRQPLGSAAGQASATLHNMCRVYSENESDVFYDDDNVVSDLSYLKRFDHGMCPDCIRTQKLHCIHQSMSKISPTTTGSHLISYE